MRCRRRSIIRGSSQDAEAFASQTWGRITRRRRSNADHDADDDNEGTQGPWLETSDDVVVSR
jgi:hypothetical protein